MEKMDSYFRSTIVIFQNRYFSELLLMDNIWADLKGKNPSNLMMYVCPHVNNFIVFNIYF